ncbi:ABC transporter substrate-binding protein [Paenibacillus sp. NFR01]|uniref:ABC transporter substrate-binding protein n=1 Tax=Paenibacillus sp. NFR01 TaxID=1566279 RepID=UPI0008C8E765|nr:ABC transporter substrate-binding protein [Paenibacillus sp. NFR01]SET34438.1 putative hydroxymethylpyrimidine transport system substrate-binding protein [Paenibacillus sp. NFR01]
MNPKFAAHAVFIALLLVLGGCSGGTPEDSGSAGKQPAVSEPHKLSLVLDWYPNAVHSFLYAAQNNGYFAEQGLQVDIQMPSDSNDALRLVAAGQADLALSYQPQVLLARSEELPVRSIAAIVRHPLNHLMVRKGSGINRPRDLTGKTAGFSSIPLYEAMLKSMVSYDGGDPRKLKLVDVGFDLVPAITSGHADAIMGGFINHEQLILEKQGYPVVSFDPADYGVPDYYELVLVASESGIQSKTDDLRKLLDALRKGQEYVQEHPQEALELLMKQQDETAPLDPEIERQSLKLLLPLMDAGNQLFGYQDPESWEHVAQWLRDNALLSGQLAAKDAFINL